MNRHQQEAKKYLSQAFGLNQRIESKLDRLRTFMIWPPKQR